MPKWGQCDGGLVLYEARKRLVERIPAPALELIAEARFDSQTLRSVISTRNGRRRRFARTGTPFGAYDMLLLVLFLGASAAVGGYASYLSHQAVLPNLEHRPGTPIEVVQQCRDAVIAPARTHATQKHAELVRIDATSAGPMRDTRIGQSAPIEVGIVYSREGGQELRQGVVECRLRNGRAVIAD